MPRYVTLAIIGQTILVFLTVWRSVTALVFLTVVVVVNVHPTTDGKLLSVSVLVPKVTTPHLPLDSVLAFLWVSSRYWDLLDSSGGVAALLRSQ